MSQSKYVGIIWIASALVYGFGTAIIQDRWFSIGGAVAFVLMAMTIPLWRRWLPGAPDA